MSQKEKEIKKAPKVWRGILHPQRFIDAFRGLYILGTTTKHFFIYVGAAILVIGFGLYFKISSLEWLAICVAVGFVMVAETFNTAIEIDIDLTSPEYHPYARDTKDVSAAAVLLSVFLAIIIGLIVFVPKIINLF